MIFEDYIDKVCNEITEGNSELDNFLNTKDGTSLFKYCQMKRMHPEQSARYIQEFFCHFSNSKRKICPKK